MPYDFSEHKVPIITNVNDAPIAPTVNKGGNGSHLINLHNSFIDATQNGVNEILDSLINLSQNVGGNSFKGWLSANSDCQATAGDKIVFTNYNPPLGVFQQTLYLPSPNPGTFASFINSNAAIEIIIDFGREPFFGNYYYQKVSLTEKAFIQIDLIYADETLGWITPQRDLLTYATSAD